MAQTTIDINDERLARLFERLIKALLRNLENIFDDEDGRDRIDRSDVESILRALRERDRDRDDDRDRGDRRRRCRHRDDDDDDEGVLGDFYDDDCRPTCNRGSRHDRHCCRRNRRRDEVLEQMVLSLWLDSRCNRRCGNGNPFGVLGAETPMLMPDMVEDLLEIANDQRAGVAGCLRRRGGCSCRNNGLAGVQQLNPSGCGCGRQ